MPLQATRESPPSTGGHLISDELIARLSNERATSTRDNDPCYPVIKNGL